MCDEFYMIKAAFVSTDIKTNSGTFNSANKGSKSLNKKPMETHFVVSEHCHHAMNCYYMKDILFTILY